jgi:hypothetical protein
MIRSSSHGRSQTTENNSIVFTFTIMLIENKQNLCTAVIRLPPSYQRRNDLPIREYWFPKLMATLLDNTELQVQVSY